MTSYSLRENICKSHTDQKFIFRNKNFQNSTGDDQTTQLKNSQKICTETSQRRLRVGK